MDWYINKQSDTLITHGIVGTQEQCIKPTKNRIVEVTKFYLALIYKFL